MPSLDVAINAARAKAGAQQFTQASNKISSGAKVIDRDVALAEKGFSRLGGQISTLIKTATGLVTLYSAGRLLKSSIQEFSKFELGLANVSTMLDETSMKHMPQYEKGLSEFSVKYGEATETLSKGLYDILSASVDAGKALDVLEVATIAARAGITDTGIAADALTTIMNAYGKSAEEASEISDILFATVKRGKTTFGEIAQSIGQVVSLASTAGLSFEEVSAALATMTRAGIQTDIAITSLRGILTTFLSPTKDNIQAAKELGLELNSNTLKTIGLTGAVQQLEGSTAEQISAVFSNVRALAGLSALLQQVDGFMYDLGETTNATGRTLEAFNKVTDSTQFKLDQLSESWREMKRNIGKEVAPSVDNLSVVMRVLGREVSGLVNLFAKEIPEAIIKAEYTLDLFAKKALQIAAKIDLTGLLPDDAIAKDIEEIQMVLDHLNGVYTAQENLAKGTMQYVEILRRAKEQASELNKLVQPIYNSDLSALGMEIDFDSVGKLKSLGKDLEKLSEKESVESAVSIDVNESKFEAAEKQFEDLRKKIEEVKLEVEDFNKTDIEKQIAQFERLNGTFRFAGDIKEYNKSVQELNDELNKLAELETKREKNREKIEAGKEVTRAFRELQNEKKLIGLTNEERERAIKLTEMEANAKILLGENSKQLTDMYIKELKELQNQKEIEELVSQVRDGVGDLIRAPLEALLDETKDFGDVLEDTLKNIGENILRTLYEQTITKPLQDLLINSLPDLIGGLFSGSSGGGGEGLFSGSSGGGGEGLLSAGLSEGIGALFAEKGAVLNKGRVKAFGAGTVVSKPTIFPMANGGVGVMAEKKPEAIMPLETDASGRLGVRASGQSEQPLKIINVLDGSTFDDYLSTGSGERRVMNIIRKNKSELESEAL